MSKELEKLCKAAGIRLVDRGNGHFQLHGKLLVNYYPESKKRSAYVAGTTSKRTHVTPAQAIEMANTAPQASARKDARRRTYKGIKRLLWKSGIRECHWCRKPLTMEPEQPNSATLEHIIPLSRGGLDNRNNMTLACPPCNHTRGRDMPELNCSGISGGW